MIKFKKTNNIKKNNDHHIFILILPWGWSFWCSCTLWGCRNSRSGFAVAFGGGRSGGGDVWQGCGGVIRSKRGNVCLGSGGSAGAHCGLRPSSSSFGGTGLPPAFQSVDCDPAGLRLGLCIRGALLVPWRGD